jgi:hypothetical protein
MFVVEVQGHREVTNDRRLAQKIFTAEVAEQTEDYNSFLNIQPRLSLRTWGVQ